MFKLFEGGFFFIHQGLWTGWAESTADNLVMHIRYNNEDIG
jgi:hypothetical protein